MGWKAGPSSGLWALVCGYQRAPFSFWLPLVSPYLSFRSSDSTSVCKWEIIYFLTIIPSARIIPKNRFIISLWRSCKFWFPHVADKLLGIATWGRISEEFLFLSLTVSCLSVYMCTCVPPPTAVHCLTWLKYRERYFIIFNYKREREISAGD